MKIDSNIVRAVEQYLEENQIQARDLAKEIGVSCAAITKWKVVGNGVSEKKWKMLFQILKPYLPHDRIFTDDSGHEQYSSVTECVSEYIFDPKYVPAMIPVFSFSQLSKYDNMLESVVQYAKKQKAKFVPYYHKHSGMSGLFDVEIKDNSLSPNIPKGSNLFASALENPKNECLVIALPVNNIPMVGIYYCDGNNFKISWNGKTIISGFVSDARKIINWVFPVLRYEVTTF